jgi:TetR/AcrR family transcriptional regulator, transcriptional repressor for nem operon
MSRPPLIAEKPRSARDKILTASFDMIRSQGYAATTVDDLCRAAGVTKGAFFHHFASKEALGVAAADFWSQTTAAFFASAPYHDHADPLDRVLGYVDFRASLIAGPVESFTCLVGTMVQEAFATNPAIREACEASIYGHARTLEADIEAALETYAVTGVTAASLAAHAQAVLQGSFILAKARGGAEAAADSIAHLKRYVMLLFKPRGGTGDVQ